VSALSFVTVLMVILPVAFLLRAAAPAIDWKFSARPVAQELRQLAPWPDAPIVLSKVPRELEYGLTFYRNEPMRRLEWGQEPKEGFLLVASKDDPQALRERLNPPGFSRHLQPLASIPQQKLQVYWVGERTAQGR
jgi:hypothetical protein